MTRGGEQAVSALSVTAKFNAASLPPIPPAQSRDEFSSSRPDPTIHRRALRQQRLVAGIAEAVTKLVWGYMPHSRVPILPGNLGVTHFVVARGGESRPNRATVVDIALSSSKVTAAAGLCPTGRESSCSSARFGAQKPDTPARNKGFNAYVVAPQCALARAHRR